MPETRPTATPYARVKQYLKQSLARGRWPPGSLMPSEADLVQRFGVSRMTVNRALRELQAEGLVDRMQGRGTFAAEPQKLHRVASTLVIRDLREEIESRGQRHHCEVQFVRAERAQQALAEQLRIEAGAMVFHSLIVHHQDGIPLQCEDRYVNPASAPDYLNIDFTQTTPTHYLLDVAPAWEAQYSIEATLPTRDEARLLGLAPHDPCLVIVRRTVSRGMPVTLARLVHPGTRFQLEGSFQP